MFSLNSINFCSKAWTKAYSLFQAPPLLFLGKMPVQVLTQHLETRNDAFTKAGSQRGAAIGSPHLFDLCQQLVQSAVFLPQVDDICACAFVMVHRTAHFAPSARHRM